MRLSAEGTAERVTHSATPSGLIGFNCGSPQRFNFGLFSKTLRDGTENLLTWAFQSARDRFTRGIGVVAGRGIEILGYSRPEPLSLPTSQDLAVKGDPL